MSFGGGKAVDDSPYYESIKNAVLSGITIVSSAGNEGPNYFTVHDPGTISEIITVGNWDTNNNQINMTSSRGPIFPTMKIKPDVMAPWANIVSFVLNNGYSTNSGTSASAPYISSIEALLKEKNKDLDFNLKYRKFI